MANFIPRQDHLNLPRFGGAAARDNLADQRTAANAFALEQARADEPMRQQSVQLDIQKKLMQLDDDQRSQVIQKMTPIKRAMDGFSLMDDQTKAVAYPQLRQFVLGQGGDPNNWGDQYDPNAFNARKMELDAIVGDKIYNDWQQKAHFAARYPERAQALGKMGAMGGGPRIEINPPGVKEEAKQGGREMGKQLGRIIEAGFAADEQLAIVDQLANIPVETGALQPLKLGIARVFSSLGAEGQAEQMLNIQVENAEAFQALSNTLVNQVLASQKGPQTEGDAIRARSTIANLGDHPLAMRFKLASLKALLLRKAQMRDFFQDKWGQGLTYAQAYPEWQQYINSTPNISSTLRSKEKLPIFYWQWADDARLRNPDASEKQINDRWIVINGKSTGE